MGIMGPEAYYQAITEGRLPRREDIISELQTMPQQEGAKGTPSSPVSM
jgi:hypothetical protein